MACTTTIVTASLTSSPLMDAKPPSQHHSTTTSPSLGLPTLPRMPHIASSPSPPLGRESWKTAAYCRRIAQNFVARAAGEARAEVGTELPEVVKTIQDTWNRVEDKYAVTSLAVAGFIALWASSGMISAVDRLPLLPGVFELVGVGYTGWFAYRNVVFKPDRDALIAKIKNTYSEIIGASS